MNYRLLHAADVHLGHRQYNVKKRQGDMFLTFRKTLHEGVNKHEVDAILIPGDLFHSRDLRPSILESAEKAFEVVPDDIPVLVSPGNHDQNLNRRAMTWLEYLHQRDVITLLQPDFEGVSGGERPVEDLFPSLASAEENVGTGVDGTVPGYVDLDVPAFDAPVRVFGLEYRGGYIDTALDQARTAIEAVNNRAGEPAHTVLMAHFGVVDEVPDLGASVRYTTLQQFEGLVDYLALGHIHKPYEGPADEPWFFNPGSLEAHDTQEARWNLGYYVTDIERDSIEPHHHTSKRRPFYSYDWDVDGYESWANLAEAFDEAVADEQSDVVDFCSAEEYATSDGTPRAPVIDFRIQGHLEFDRRDLDVDALESKIFDTTNPIHVQTKVSVTTAEILDLVEGLDEDAVFTDTGTLRTEVLEGEVFTTVAEQTPYAEDPEATAEVLARAKELVIEEGASGESVADYLQRRRQEVFADGVGAVDPEFDDVADQADAGGVDAETFAAVQAGENVDPIEAAQRATTSDTDGDPGHEGEDVKADTPMTAERGED
ncbi:metallophosphoesterase family protein [Natrinema longum]|uniref:metallophosphoesterase family protein n=1 Tax=Natrinema longum TaxID=370324 RepID=UPI001CCD23AE|nr:metallophosphoesterase [Natrinema longum]MBZ6497111.1 metallophosphoesterase [Natrinema longum]